MLKDLLFIKKYQWESCSLSSCYFFKIFNVFLFREEVRGERQTEKESQNQKQASSTLYFFFSV